MLKGQEIVYFGNNWVSDNRTSSRHVAEYLAKHNRLLYVQLPGVRRPSASGHDLKRIFSTVLSWLRGPKRLDERLYIYSLVQIPFRQFPLVTRLNRLIGLTTLKWACWRLKFKNPIVWSTLPHAFALIGGLKERLTVYYCVDNFVTMPGVDVCRIKEADERLTRSADLVFVPSQTMVGPKKALNPKTFVSPPGVDLEIFSKALDPATPLPREIASLPHPIIGYFGLMERWIDLNLIKYIASNRPQWSIVMIGRVATNISPLSSCPNVYFLGPRPYSQLPGYARAFDVAIIPEILDDNTVHADNIKLREYLGAGRPVISIRNAGAQRLKNLVRIADSYQEFLSKIEEALQEDTEELRWQRMQAMQNESWERKVRRVSAIADTILRKKCLSECPNPFYHS